MNLSRLFTIANFELVRLFKTKRGVISLITFSAVWFIILYYFVSSAAQIVTSNTFADAAKQIFGMFGADKVLNWPVAEFSIYWLVAVYSFPIFSLFACGDQTCSDRSRGTLRFISLRSTRTEIILGRFVGQLIIISLLILATILATILLSVYRDSSLFLSAFSLASQIFVHLLIITLPFIALMTFFNSFMSSPKLSIVSAILFYSLGPLILAFMRYQIGTDFYLTYIFPGTQIGANISLMNMGVLAYATPILQTIILLFSADQILKRTAI